MKKIGNVIMVLLLVVSTVFSQVSHIYAKSSQEVSDYPKKESIEYKGKTTYGNNIVGNFSIGGKQAFCLQHPKTTPSTGTKVTSQIYEDPNVQKVLYYGWKGPQQWSGFKSESHGIVVTSLALSYYYYGDNSSPSTISGFLNYIKNLSVPDFSVRFSDEHVQAYKEGQIQRTKTMSLESESSLFDVTISLPSQVTYVDETHNKRQTGGSVTINGQTKFHLEASLNEKLVPYSTGQKISSYKFQPIVAETSSSSLQNVGYGEYISQKHQTTSMSVDWLQLAELEITKTDVYQQLIDGAVFRLWNQNDYDQEIVVKDGHITVKELTTGIYYLQEVKAPEGFLVDDTVYTVTLNAGDKVHQSVTDKEPTGEIKVMKTNEHQDKLAKAEFDIIADGDIYSAGGKLLLKDKTIVDHIVSDISGLATSKTLPLGKYEVIETKAPEGYLLNHEHFKVELKYMDQMTSVVTTSATVTNQEPKGSIEFQKKIDSQITNGHQGDVFLSQNEYGLYAKEVIQNAAKTVTYYTKDQLISQKVTDDQGKITWDNLPIGHYYLKELKSNASLIINPEIINVDVLYAGMNTAHIVSHATMTDTVASQRIQIFKEGTKEGASGVVQGLKGAEFIFVLNSEYEKVGFEKATKYFTGVTDEKGYLTTSLLPYGIYRVKETKTPNGYYGASDFLVSVEKDSSLYEVGYRIQKVTVNNVPFESLLKVIKVDQQTGKTVQLEGTTFKIKDLTTNEYVSYVDWSAFPHIYVDQWTTHKDGSMTLNTKLKSGKYQLEEIKAPTGYLLNKTPVVFEITQDYYDLADDQKTPITVVKLSDKAVTGRVTLEKTGEVLTDYKDGKFVYEQQGLANAKFEIYAKENIVDSSGNGEFIYKKGELVETLTTKEKGRVTSKELPLGEYECLEVEAPYGYVLDTERKSFSLVYENQDVEIVYEHCAIQDERQKIEIEVVKKDQATQQMVSGAEFSLIANRDIYNVNGEVIVKAGTVLEKVTSTQNGKAVFQSDLPLDLTPEYATMPLEESVETIGNPNSLYVVKETKQPYGYVSKKVNYYVDAKYTQHTDTVLHYTHDFYNQKTKTIIHKVDLDTLKNIEGAHLQIIDPQTRRVVADWISQQDGYVIEGLAVDKVYILHEVSAPEGYLVARDYELIIQDQESEQTITFINEKAPIEVLGDEPVVTHDLTRITPYVLIMMGSVLCLQMMKKKKNEK
ncbi:SpaA isopeptide-forming pilin-related protein [Candidatus Stoquefichus massiliensis]|uniref:SpaA isopeptide-forming pilin-related protein n=1 Tax=Candidatus Stoquefichus massiliensis TaxID=1470350 RepID=UPI0004B4B7D0|nr:SpaA isopeptide-forming pilin-related protein [Candidatus Stoquefichus massiliensis]